MAQVNENYKRLSENYLFSEVSRRVTEYKAANPDFRIISLGIGDVTQPLCDSVVTAMESAVREMSSKDTFHGYAPECGYRFLIDKIISHDYESRNIHFTAQEIFVNDGAKSSLGHFCDILSTQNLVAICDPVYPVYVDTNLMDGRKILYLACEATNGFIPQLPAVEHPDIIYICSPNNPTGTAMTRKELKMWVDYAREHNSVILFDSAYEAFISDDNIPHSIYEIEGAKEVAVEFRSYSKTAGFTGLRCGYTVVPLELKVYDASGDAMSLNALWRRHQCTRFNGTAYPVQRGAEAIYSSRGQQQVKETIDYYMNNARYMVQSLREAGFTVYGGENAPYIWWKTPRQMGSWDFFDTILHLAQVVTTPGVGFGKNGNGYIRLTAFADHEDVKEAIKRIKKLNL